MTNKFGKIAKKTGKVIGRIALWVYIETCLATMPINLRNNSYDFTLDKYRIHNLQEVKKENTINNSQKRENYALLINGDVTSRLEKMRGRDFSRNIKQVYNSFNKNNTPDSNMYVLNPKKLKGFEGNYYKPNKNNLEKATKELSEEVETNDRFFVYVTNHGNKTDKGESYFPMIIGRIDETKFNKMLKEINPKYSVMVFSQCYSGGFAKKLGEGNNIGISNTGVSHPASVGKEAFSEHFFLQCLEI